MELTIAHSFYGQDRIIPVHQAAWKKSSEHTLRYSIIDDCSPNPIIPTTRPGNVDAYRITSNIHWNIAGARNLAFHVATTRWVLCLDADHLVSEVALRSILALDVSDDNVVYCFARRRAHDGFYGCRAVMNIMMSKEKYFGIGGYDEEFCGHYGKEDIFFNDCLVHRSVNIVHRADIVLDWNQRLGRTRGLSRDKSINNLLYEKKLHELRENKYKNGPLLRFDWMPM